MSSLARIGFAPQAQRPTAVEGSLLTQPTDGPRKEFPSQRSREHLARSIPASEQKGSFDSVDASLSAKHSLRSGRQLGNGIHEFLSRSRRRMGTTRGIIDRAGRKELLQQKPEEPFSWLAPCSPQEPGQ